MGIARKTRWHVVKDTGRYRELAVALAQPTDYALEVGSAAGGATALLARHARRALGVDGALHSVELARGRYPHVNFEVCRGEDLASLRGLMCKHGVEPCSILFVDVGGSVPVRVVRPLCELLARELTPRDLVVKSRHLADLPDFEEHLADPLESGLRKLRLDRFCLAVRERLVSLNEPLEFVDSVAGGARAKTLALVASAEVEGTTTRTGVESSGGPRGELELGCAILPFADRLDIESLSAALKRRVRLASRRDLMQAGDAELAFAVHRCGICPPLRSSGKWAFAAIASELLREVRPLAIDIGPSASVVAEGGGVALARAVVGATVEGKVITVIQPLH